MRRRPSQPVVRHGLADHHSNRLIGPPYPGIRRGKRGYASVMASTSEKERGELEVRPNEFDGWDVKHAGTADAIANFPDREQALEAARRIAEHENGEVEVVVRDEAEHDVSDEGRGVKFYFVVLLAILALATLIIVITGAIGGGTEFGADDANLGEGTVLNPLATL